jgi:hypothetical protein
LPPGLPAVSVRHAVDRALVPVIVLVADGARPDALSGDLSAFPALKRLRDEGGRHEITSVFPSVTGPAYLPFLAGRFPGTVGVPGLRWYDRARTACGWPDYARSYVGWQMDHVNSDLDADAPTIFELAPNSIAAMSMITRGLTTDRVIGGLTARWALRAIGTHFRGRVQDWLAVDRDVANHVVRRAREERPDYLFAALTGVDKASHARGHEHELVHDALAIVDDVAQRLRADAEKSGRWDDLHLWIVSDHGHSAVHTHADLATIVADGGHRVVAHPWSAGLASDVAVMVSGNAMAHLYVELDSRERLWWPRLGARWSRLARLLLTEPSVDLLLLPHSPTQCEVRSAARGGAMVERGGGGDHYQYRRLDGDPMGFQADISGTADELHDATAASDYPDGVVQILALAGSARAGDLIVSAVPGHDFRARYEPIPHRSAHGALHRDHMCVPLLTNRPPVRRPRRTTDLFASAIDALGIAPPPRLDGMSFL